MRICLCKKRILKIQDFLARQDGIDRGVFMNCTVFILECAIMMAIFGVLVFGLLLINPITFVSDYPPEIQERYYNSQNKVYVKEKLTKIMIVKKVVALIIFASHVKVLLPMIPVFAVSGIIISFLMVWLW